MADLMSSIKEQLDQTTVISLTIVLLILNSAHLLSKRVLPPTTPRPYRILFIWHAFDFMIHTIFEGSFLYNCFVRPLRIPRYPYMQSSISHLLTPIPQFASAPFDPATHHPALLTNFLNDSANVYGSRYGDNWGSKLWMVYAKADKRWAEADLTVVSLELLTVLGAGPLALWICWGISRRDSRVAFWMIVLATGELYGGMPYP
jgi:hypothetical protein